MSLNVEAKKHKYSFLLNVALTRLGLAWLAMKLPLFLYPQVHSGN